MRLRWGAAAGGDRRRRTATIATVRRWGCQRKSNSSTRAELKREQCRGEEVQAEEVAIDVAQVVAPDKLGTRLQHPASAARSVREGAGSAGRGHSASADSSSRVVTLLLLEVLLQQALDPPIMSGAVVVRTTFLPRPGRRRGVHGSRLTRDLVKQK